MRHVVAVSVLMMGLLVGTPALSFASQSIQPAHTTDRLETPSQAGGIEHADYYYHHHRYHHRRWDKRHRRWYYY